MTSDVDPRDPQRQGGGASAAGRVSTRESRPADVPAIRRTIGRAFFDDPIAVHLFPDESARRARFGAFAELAMDQFVGAGATWVDDDVHGAAIWQAPSPPPLDPWRQARLALRLLWIARARFSRAVRLGEAIEEHRFEQPHWYLAILGTEPEAQGRGIGSALMEPILSRCDEKGTPAYLESSKESNIPFYQRHGFEVTREIRIPDGPRVWPMVRRPG